MTDAPDMRAAAEAALPITREDWQAEPVGRRPDSNMRQIRASNYILAMGIDPRIAAHIVASQPRAVLALLDEHEALIHDMRSVQGAASDAYTELAQMTAERDALRAAMRTAQEALVQGRGALRLDHMVDEEGQPYGTTTVALEAIDEALATIGALK